MVSLPVTREGRGQLSQRTEWAIAGSTSWNLNTEGEEYKINYTLG